MGRLIIALALAAALAGCASTIMKNYVGSPLQSVMVDYGPPANAFDMPDGTRAFQWVMDKSYVTPTNVQNSGGAYGVGNSVMWTQRTQITGGVPITSRCSYTMFARWNDAANTWVIESFRKPKFTCE